MADQKTEQRIVVHFQDGKVMKGTSQDFFPNKDRFHLILLDSPAGQKPREIELTNLKALFFVKDFVGDKDHKPFKGFPQSVLASYGKKTIVKFKDGEVLFGFTQSYSPNRSGFFLFTHNQDSNNLKVFVIQSFVATVDFPT